MLTTPSRIQPVEPRTDLGQPRAAGRGREAGAERGVDGESHMSRSMRSERNRSSSVNEVPLHVAKRPSAMRCQIVAGRETF